MWDSRRSSSFSLGLTTSGVEARALGRFFRAGVFAVCAGAQVVTIAHAAVGHREEWERPFAAKKWPEAIIAIKAEIAKRPDDLALSEKLAVALVYARRREEALQFLARALDKEASPARKAELIRKLRVISRTFVEDRDFQTFQSGVNALRRGDLKQAGTAWVQALAQEPDHVEILIRLGQLALLEGDVDTAAERLRTARALNAHEPYGDIALGEALIRRGETTEGLALLRSGFARAPECESCPAALALGLARTGKRIEAIQVLEAALRKGGGEERDSWIVQWALLQMEGAPTAPELVRIRRELATVGSRSMGAPSVGAIQLGQDLSLTRVRSSTERELLKKDAERLMDKIQASQEPLPNSDENESED